MSASPPVTRVTVDPTLTVVVPEVDVRAKTLLTVQIVNQDAAQTFTGTVWTRLNQSLDWSPMPLSDFASVPGTGSAPSNSVTANIDVTGQGFVRVTGVMSGAGGPVDVSYRAGGVEK